MIFDLCFAQPKVQEPSNFLMARSDGASRYIFFHFSTPVEITINGKTEIINPGAVILYTPGVPQFFRPFNTRLIHDYVDFELIDSTFFEDIHFPLNTVIYPRISQQITSIISQIDQNNTLSTIGSKYVNDGLFCSLLIDISKKLFRKKHQHGYDTNSTISKKFESLRLELFNNPKNKTVSTLANEVGYSLSYFNKIYNRLFKTSPINDLTKARLEYAKTKLLEGADIIDITNDLCFSNIEYFYKWFKNLTGLTPKELIDTNLYK